MITLTVESMISAMIKVEFESAMNNILSINQMDQPVLELPITQEAKSK